MALYKIGITEAGDAGVDLSWVEKLDRVDAAVLITKCVSPDFFDATLEHKDRLIVHATITGQAKQVTMTFRGVRSLFVASYRMETHGQDTMSIITYVDLEIITTTILLRQITAN